jgi:predicted transcriptional regulator
VEWLEKVRKNYRLDSDTTRKLAQLQMVSGRTETAMVEEAIKYIHGEYIRATKGMDHDELAVCQVLGVQIEKAV